MNQFMSDLERAVWREAFPAIVGRAIFCPCGSVLDCRRAVEVSCRCNGKVVSSKVLCAKCFDKSVAPRMDDDSILSDIADAAGMPLWTPPSDTRTLPMFAGIDPAAQPAGTVRVEVEIIDGRVVMGGAR